MQINRLDYLKEQRDRYAEYRDTDAGGPEKHNQWVQIVKYFDHEIAREEASRMPEPSPYRETLNRIRDEQELVFDIMGDFYPDEDIWELLNKIGNEYDDVINMLEERIEQEEQ